MGGSKQIGYTEKLKSFYKEVKEGPALNSHLGILQSLSSSKLYILLSRTLMGGFWQHGDSQVAKFNQEFLAIRRAISLNETFVLFS